MRKSIMIIFVVLESVAVFLSKDVCEHTAIHPSNKEKLAKKISRVLAI